MKRLKVVAGRAYAARVAELADLTIERDTLLALAKACGACQGSGILVVAESLQAVLGQVTTSCSDCADIRKALA